MTRLHFLLLAGAVAMLMVPALIGPADAVPGWTSPNHYRVLLTVDPRGVARDNSPAWVDVDLPGILASWAPGTTFDESTIEVVAYDGSGAAKVFDASRAGYEKYLLPWRVQDYYGVNTCTLSFVMPSDAYTQYAVYFDTAESGLGKPERYPGMVGDGDLFKEGYGRREINACHMDSFADFDGDGDLDLFKGGVEPFIYCYENVGGNKFVDRGRLTNDTSLFELPCGDNHRSWVTLEFHDWDEDGDQDLFASFTDGPDRGYIRKYENTTDGGDTIKFVDRGRLLTQTGKSLGDGWFGCILIVDWDNDGKKDMLAARESMFEFHKNVGSGSSVSGITLADGVYVTANGDPIRLGAGRADCADLDGDGDLDLMMGCQNGEVFWFKNVGTRSNPVFTAGRLIAMYEFMDCYTYPEIHDFDGDGLLDFVVGRYWERTHFPEQDRMFGKLYKNIGTPTAPKWEARDASNGAPYTERFQICDIVRQNGVRAVDWNNDGKTDLIGADTDGFIWYFRNQTNELFPTFVTGEKVEGGGEPVRTYADGNWGGYARADVGDWNGDGKKDLFVADGRGWLFAFVNEGTDADPVLGAAIRLSAGGVPIDGSERASVLQCDWDNDGIKDIVFGDDTGFYFCENTGNNTDPVLGPLQLITLGGQSFGSVRPNLGSYVDWNLDGKKDFIAGDFEVAVQYHENNGSGGMGVKPVFDDPDGVTVVQDYSVQMVSGADAVDWNGDGDIDILTGQGHGGSGIRFYERDHIDDFVNSERFPIVSVGTSEPAVMIAEVKSLANGASVTVVQGIVTACFDDFFYIEAQERTSGIRVEQSGHGRSIGEMVDVRGVLGTNAAGERYIAATSVTVNI